MNYHVPQILDKILQPTLLSTVAHPLLSLFAKAGTPWSKFRSGSLDIVGLVDWMMQMLTCSYHDDHDDTTAKIGVRLRL